MPAIEITMYCGICCHHEGEIKHEHPDDGNGLIFTCKNCQETINRLRLEIKKLKGECHD